jgi:ornithine decarboxylase
MGPALEASAGRRHLGAEKTLFCPQRTSASNKIVLSSLVAEDDLVS